MTQGGIVIPQSDLERQLGLQRPMKVFLQALTSRGTVVQVAFSPVEIYTDDIDRLIQILQLSREAVDVRPATLVHEGIVEAI